MKVKATGIMAQGVAFVGNGGANGLATTVNGLELFGDTDGNVDANSHGATFQGFVAPGSSRG